MKTIITENLQKTQRYIPHTLETRLAVVKTYRNKTLLALSVDVTKFLRHL